MIPSYLRLVFASYIVALETFDSSCPVFAPGRCCREKLQRADPMAIKITKTTEKASSKGGHELMRTAFSNRGTSGAWYDLGGDSCNGS